MRTHRDNARTPIGIDLDYYEFRAVQMSAMGTPIAIATIPRQGRRLHCPSSEELSLLAQNLAQRGFIGSEVVIGVPKECSSFHILDLPPERSGAPISRLALLEAQRSGAHKTQDLQIGYWTQPAKKPPSKFTSPYYTVASETVPLDDMIDQFEAAGLIPIRIEPIETALARTATAHPEFTGDAIHSIIEIGWDHSWAIITLGHTPVYTRKIDFGTSRICRQLIGDHAIPPHAINTLLNPKLAVLSPDSKVGRIVSALLTPMLSQIVDQLDIALTYVSQQHRTAPFGVVFRSGYYAGLDQAAHAIAQRTGMPTIPLSAARHDDELLDQTIQPFEFDQSPRLNIAAGFALGGAA